MEQIVENKMGTKKMLPLILTMSLPAMFSMLVQSMYNVVDSIFVGQLGQDALTAMGLAFPLQQLLIAVAVGTGVGINSLVSRRLGEKNQADANSAATHGILLGMITGLAFAVFALAVTRFFFGMFSDSKNVIDLGSTYIYIVLIFSMPTCIEVNIEKTLQSTGNMLFPMLFQLSGAVTNIILDPILIFGLLGFPKMGIAGAAVATVLGQVVSLIFSIIIIKFKKHIVEIKLKGFKPNKYIIAEIYKVGAPSIVMQAISSVLTSAMNGILMSFGVPSGDAAVAVLGIYFKLQSFIFMPVFGLTQGVMPIMGYNYGAKKKSRLKSCLLISTIIALIIMVVGTAAFSFFPNLLLGIFSPSAIMLQIGVPALRIISLCFIPAAIGIVFSTMFQAVGMGMKSLIISVLRQLVLILPIAFFLSLTGVVENVWFAFPLAELFSLIVSIVMMRSLFKKHINTLGTAK